MVKLTSSNQPEFTKYTAVYSWTMEEEDKGDMIEVPRWIGPRKAVSRITTKIRAEFVVKDKQ